MPDTLALADKPLKAGDRFQLTAEGARVLRPRGTVAGLLVMPNGDEWYLIYDGTKTPRSVHKIFIRRETVR